MWKKIDKNLKSFFAAQDKKIERYFATQPYVFDAALVLFFVMPILILLSVATLEHFKILS